MARQHRLLVLALLSSIASAQPAIDFSGDVSLADYLSALAQIAPAAREGAEAYLQAFAQRCGRELSVMELRRRVADGTGDPVLMQMMRAAQRKDRTALQRLSASIDCSSRT